jgi:hypothetical protein
VTDESELTAEESDLPFVPPERAVDVLVEIDSRVFRGVLVGLPKLMLMYA